MEAKRKKNLAHSHVLCVYRNIVPTHGIESVSLNRLIFLRLTLLCTQTSVINSNKFLSSFGILSGWLAGWLREWNQTPAVILLVCLTYGNYYSFKLQGIHYHLHVTLVNIVLYQRPDQYTQINVFKHTHIHITPRAKFASMYFKRSAVSIYWSRDFSVSK